MKFPRRTLEDPAINLTPLIDVVFLLLIFFMVTTTFTRETRLAVNLPEADAAPAEQQQNQIEVLVNQNGRYSINNELLADNLRDTLRDRLIDVAGGNLNQTILLIADAESSHQAVITAMDAIGQAGFSGFSIATRQPGQDDSNNE
ncbi:ExbD/TolR family protein [Pseudohongiella spirulinae]|uniref:Biopolymer transport protein ExbD/TolR n=1 Tax=Pseudohongiella spirulinae TaxID=1249552 RepID=A0A0S2KDS5_9GAMM|nr:biopolymer transporter ExbD [Pseudohongiella spirulinae]ALO46465.1 Biopolymer transport protein ExbD/TolR [Pseudohongiella spirulinae]